MIDTSSLTPRDKENAGANSTRNASQSESMDTSKSSLTSSSLSTATAIPAISAPPSARTPSSGLRFASLHPSGQPRASASPTFFSAAKTPSPASNSKGFHKQQEGRLIIAKHLSPVATTPNQTAAIFGGNKSPPGTSQVLRKHFQSLGFGTPPGKHAHSQHRLLSSGAVRTPNSDNHHTSNRNQHSPSMANAAYNMRIGIDGTKYTPSKELLKSTTSSRNQRVMGLQDVSMDQQQHLTLLEHQHNDDDSDDMQSVLPPVMDDETSTVASGVTAMDDASVDISLPSMTMNQHQPRQLHHNPNHPFHNISRSLSSPSTTPAPLSPLTPRTGCLNPVAMTLLNEGKEDYHYLLEEDSLYPLSREEGNIFSASREAVEVTASYLPQQQATNTSMSSTSSSSSCCLSPTATGGGISSVQQSPAQVRGSLPHTVRSTLAYPVAIMPKTGRISPSTNHTPRLLMRPQPNVR